jgi:hypothetical protein
LMRLQEFLAIDPAPINTALEIAGNKYVPENVSAGTVTFSQNQIVWIENWLPPLLAHVHSIPAYRIRLQLLACLGIWRFSPQQLRAPSAWALWLDKLEGIARAMHLVVSPGPATREITQHLSLDTIIQPADTAVKNEIATDSNQQLFAKNIDANLSTVSISPIETSHQLTEAPSPETAINYRYIQQAGFLYLLNWLRDYPLLADLAAPVSPWLWLVYFHRECCTAWQLPLDNSLQQLLLEIAGLDEQDFNEARQLFHASGLQAARVFLQERLAKFQIGNYDWISVPARISVEQGYIQIYLHESVVRLELRLAGLDLNPGWVPVLGRVINFHFGYYPDLGLHQQGHQQSARQSFDILAGGLPNE